MLKMKMRNLSILAVVAMAVVLLVVSRPKPVLAAGSLRIAVIMPSSTADMAFSQCMFDALKAVQKEMGGEVVVKIAYSDNMFKPTDAAAAIRDYASHGYDIIIAHSSLYESSVEDVAKEFPRTTFAWGTDAKTFGLPNVYAYTAAAEEGGFVNGVLAAKLTKSKTIGVTGPLEVGDAKTYVSGFVQGVASVDPKIRVAKTWTGSFSDTAQMTQAAKTHIAAGADVLTGTSESAVGSIAVAKATGRVLWFGTQQNQAPLAPQIVVASQQYDWTGVIKQIIANRKAGKLGGQSYVARLNNGGLKMVYNPSYPLPPAAKAAGDKAIKDISSGKLKIKP
jgi:basic membrane lipoprotein Med (substrate-binding protein (PBP1-ABC) superfamily)